MNVRVTSEAAAPVGVGYYGLAEAGRLLQAPSRTLRRWMTGYSYRRGAGTCEVPPLWRPQLPTRDDSVELTFRDLIELRFVKAFVDAGIDLRIVRSCLEVARVVVGSDRPFSTRQFRTDGKTIFLEGIGMLGNTVLLDLRRKQFTFHQIVEQTFRDLDIEGEAVARWRPFDGKTSIVIDPGRAFGQPIATEYGVPTVALAEAVVAEGSEVMVSRLFEVPLAVVRDAVGFERRLNAV